MAIEFHCPGCGKLVRTPDKSAGKRGQCPHCQTKVQIPTSSLATSTRDCEDDLPVPPAKSAGPVTPAKTVPASTASAATSFEFVCSRCHQTLAVAAAAAGKRGKCPHCGTVMALPARPPAVGRAGSQSTTAVSGAIRFNCPLCQRSVKVPAQAAGLRGQCPHCKSVVQIPSPARAAVASGVTPIDPPEAPPRGKTAAVEGSPFSDLAVWDNGIPGDSLAELPPAAPAAPATAPVLPAVTVKRPQVFKPKIQVPRSGLPWDKQAGVEGAFGKTTKLILFSPNKAFCMMSRQGGVGRPLAYSFLGFVGGVMLNVLYVAVTGGLVLLISYFVFQADGQQIRSAGQVLLGYGIIVALLTVGYLIQASLVVIGGFINAAISHVLLMAVEGANQSYETSYRATAYTLGACGGVLFVPLLGILVLPFLYPVLAILALKNAHETSGPRATFAVLLPYAILCGCYAGLLVFSNAMSAVFSAPLQGIELPS